MRDIPAGSASSQLRTLQRRIRDYRALHGPDREVYFQQEHPPGREAQVDFTHCSGLGVTIGGETFRHLLFHLVLSHSGWSYAEVCFEETFAALVKGLQGALWELGGVPRVIRTDNLSRGDTRVEGQQGPCHERQLRGGTGPLWSGGHQNQPTLLGRERRCRAETPSSQERLGPSPDTQGSRDFDSEEEYRTFVRRIVDRRNRLVSSKLNSERRHLHPLPPAPVPEYVNYRVRVRRWSTIRVANRTYSVPSRLIGVVVDVRLYADHIEVYYKGHLVESMERVHGTGEAQIDYRHIIGSLVRKPGAFARYCFREQMFPTHTFRLAYDALCGWRGERADVEYVRILHLAATTMESEVDRALGRLLESGLSFDYAMVRRLSAPAPPPVPDLKLSGTVDLGAYDRLLVGGAR